MYILFTCEVNFPIWRLYLGCHYDVINVKIDYEKFEILFSNSDCDTNTNKSVKNLN